jgi:hypothetical protein
LALTLVSGSCDLRPPLHDDIKARLKEAAQKSGQSPAALAIKTRASTK